jgi:formylmethanofuran dehydrogenase subunit E
MATNSPTNVTIRVNPQLLTSFPNSNEKLIDYVIVYEKLDNENDEHSAKKKLIQTAFLTKLKNGGFEIYEIEHKHEKKTHVYALLNCSNDRLLEEAELSRLDMIIKNVILPIYSFSILIFNAFYLFFSKIIIV